ncbi:MAG TPA: caspase family protein [Acidobacteriaceae bacterium]|nr:caspase family protein [Acidobacteriaceae bacterium]
MTARRTMIAAALALLLLASSAAARADDDRCGAGKDLVVQALERVRPTSSDDAFEDALELLKHAVSTCAELGDAWYYRSLVEERLGNTRLAQYSLQKAQTFGSEAMQEGLNPFVLATPIQSRALHGDTQQPGQPSPNIPAVAGPVQQKWALVIGVGQFQDPAIPTLHYTTADAKAFALQLADPAIGRFPPDHVGVLLDDQATTKNIKEKLNWIARNAKPNDLVVIYVATHGSPRTDDSAGGANYIVTYDTDIGQGKEIDEDALYATALPMVELANAVASRMKALRTAVILDTCYSGGAVTNAAKMMAPGLANSAPSPAMLERMADGTGRIVVAAARSDEESLESDSLQHGYFTYYLLEAMRANKGMDPMSQVYNSVAQAVEQQVDALAKKQGKAFGQHPVMSRSSSSADFALGVAGGS